MIKIFKTIYQKYFSDPEATILLLFLLISFSLVISMGNVLAPVLISVVLAYLLQWWVTFLAKQNIPHIAACSIVFIAFLAIFILAILFLFPLLWRQLINLFNELPSMLQNAKESLTVLIEKYPAYFSENQINSIISNLMQDVQSWAKKLVSSSFSYISGAIAWVIYLILVPILVFLFLKDSNQITKWFVKYLPKDRKVLYKVWKEMDSQIGNYIRGKITEITIVGVATYIVFLFFGLKYSALLATLVGLSVVIPYVGAVIVTIPVVLVGYLQWGFSPDFTYMFISYLVVQALDGNLLVPILFSEAVNLHPIAIIVAILLFGSCWGFWGVFFAIPLATLVKTVISVWPTKNK